MYAFRSVRKVWWIISCGQPDRISDIFGRKIPVLLRSFSADRETIEKNSFKSAFRAKKKPFPEFDIPMKLILLPELALREEIGFFLHNLRF